MRAPYPNSGESGNPPAACTGWLKLGETGARIPIIEIARRIFCTAITDLWHMAMLQSG
jgi:hypothetical protein